MRYFVYSLTESFDSTNVYHVVDTTSPKRAACMYALNEESLYGMCDDQYNIYDDVGSLITRVDVEDRFSYLDIKPTEKKEPKISSGMDWLDEMLESGIDPLDHGNHVPYEELNKPTVNIDGTEFSLFDFGGMELPKFDFGSSMMKAYSEISKTFRKDEDSKYNPIIAREFLKQANFSAVFTNRYGFFIAESEYGVFGANAREIQIVFTGATKDSAWPDTFSNGDLDQLNNIGAVLGTCGVTYFKSMENIWTLTSTRWNEDQIATIATRVLIKCKLKYTGMHPSDSDNDMLNEYKGRMDLPRQLDFLS